MDHSGLIPANRLDKRSRSQGRWVLAKEKSDFGDEPMPKQRVIHITCSNESRFAWVMQGISAEGRAIENAWSGPVDGTPCEVQGRPGWKMAFRWQGELLITEATTPASTRKEETEFSSDGKTMKIRGVETRASVERHWMEVYERK